LHEIFPFSEQKCLAADKAEQANARHRSSGMGEKIRRPAHKFG